MINCDSSWCVDIQKSYKPFQFFQTISHGVKSLKRQQKRSLAWKRALQMRVLFSASFNVVYLGICLIAKLLSTF